MTVRSRLFRYLRCAPILALVVGVPLLPRLAAAGGVELLRVGTWVVPEGELSRAAAKCGALELTKCFRDHAAFGWLLGVAAAEKKLEKAPELRRLRNDWLAERLRSELKGGAKAPKEEEIAGYLRENQREFKKPLRLHLWRVLLPSEAQARELVAKLDAKMTPEQWRNFARAQSLDKATHERGGELGMVWPDGTTDIPQLRAEPALYAAALPLADGEWVKEPVPESGRFAVVWRRDHLPPEETNPELARRRALERLGNERAKAAEDELVAALRKSSLREYAPARLEKLHIAFEKL